MGHMADALRYLAAYLDAKKIEAAKPLPARLPIPILVSSDVPEGVIIAIDPGGGDPVVMVNGRIIDTPISRPYAPEWGPLSPKDRGPRR